MVQPWCRKHWCLLQGLTNTRILAYTFGNQILVLGSDPRFHKQCWTNHTIFSTACLSVGQVNWILCLGTSIHLYYWIGVLLSCALWAHELNSVQHEIPNDTTCCSSSYSFVLIQNVLVCLMYLSEADTFWCPAGGINCWVTYISLLKLKRKTIGSSSRNIAILHYRELYFRGKTVWWIGLVALDNVMHTMIQQHIIYQNPLMSPCCTWYLSHISIIFF